MQLVPLKALAFFTAVGLSSAAWSQSDTLTIVHINDTHSALAPLGPRGRDLKGRVGGIGRAASVIRGIRSRDPRAILLHAGDYSMGDIMYNVFLGIPELQILRQLGLDAMAVGNHEWDLGPSTLLRVLDTTFAGGCFPLLSANTRLDDPTLERHRRYIIPWTIIHSGRLKVGVFGLTTPAANSISSPSPAYIDTPFVHAAKAIAHLRMEGCRPILCLSHLGFTLDRELAARVPGIDLIVGGHDHRSLKRPVPVVRGGDTTWIVQTAGFYREVGVVRLVVAPDGVRLSGYRLVSVKSPLPEDSTVTPLVASLTALIEKDYGPMYTSRVGRSTAMLAEESTSLLAEGHRDTPVGNLVTDAFRDLTGTDLAIEPGGSTAQPIYVGPLVPADLFRVVGYGYNPVNRLGYHLARFDIQGDALLTGIKYSLSTISEDDEYFLQVSGMRYTYDPDADPANRFVSAAVRGSRIDPTRTYSVTANIFVAGFMEHLGIPLTRLHEFGGDTTEFMALTRYVKKLGTMGPGHLSRILSTRVHGGGVAPSAVSPRSPEPKSGKRRG